MGIGEILWLFFMLSALQPVVRQKMLEASRLRLLSRVERSRRSQVIALVHRQETIAFSAFRSCATSHEPLPATHAHAAAGRGRPAALPAGSGAVALQ